MKNISRKKIFARVAGIAMLAFFAIAIAVMPAKAGKKGTWLQDSVGWWYKHEDGTYTANDWEEIDGAWYWFDANGYRYTGWKQFSDGDYYFFDENGVMVTNNWQQSGDKYYYLGEDGVMVKTAWRKINGYWRYFNSSGEWVDDNSHETGSLKGIDVSKYQGNIDWAAVKNFGTQFAFVRVGHGSRTLDPYYAKNMKGANEVGIPVGVYFYSTATDVKTAILDAQFVIENLKGYTVSYPVVIDVEDRNTQGNLSKAEVTNIAKAFCDEIRAAGYTPMIYCDESWYKQYIDASQLENVEKWIARYNVKYNTDIPRGIWQCSSRGRVDGISGNVDIDFGYKDYTTIVTARTTVADTYTPTKGIWASNQNGWWFEYLSGGYPTNKWENINGYNYWFDASGYMKTGWLLDGNNWYYLNGDGKMATGWVYDSGNWYYMYGDGKMATGWVLDGSTWYHMAPNGVMEKGWQHINGKWYLLSESGAMLTDWQLVNGTWYYMYESGEMAANTWIGNYYVDASGAWTNTRPAAGWVSSGSRWWYRHSDGSYTTSGWELIDGKWYYFDAAGWMTTGWQKVNGTWYYMDASGAMTTGWQLVNGTWYYMYESGAMAANTWIGNYYVDASGAWTATR